MLKVGSYAIHRIDAGRFRLDGGAMFGVVPKVLWEKRKPADEKNRIAMATMLVLLDDGRRRILIDTGIGQKNDPKFEAIYAVDHSQFNLMGSLEAHGYSADSITDVILTHLHFDHAGGATRLNGKEQVLPTFPNATYYVQEKQWTWALSPSERDRASFLPENFVPLKEAGQLELLNGEMELFPGVRVIPIHGHTPGQQMVLVEGTNRSFLFAGDLLPTPAHVPLAWIMSYDLHPLTTLEEKKIYLERAASENWLVFFEHDPEIYCATIRKTEREDYRAEEAVTFK